MWQSWVGWKMPLCKWHIFWMAPCLIFYFIVILFNIERKWLFEKFSHYLTFEVQIVWKISATQYYCWKYRNTEKQLNFEKFQLIWKIVKHLTRLKQRAALRKLFSLSSPCIPPDKTLLRPCNKHFLRKIYKNIQTLAFKLLHESSVRKWCSANVFSDTKQKDFCWKICKLIKFFGCVFGAYYFQFQRSWDLQNEWGFSEKNCIVKWVIFVTSFFWLWDFLLQNLE